jgi:hypothetical protein
MGEGELRVRGMKHWNLDPSHDEKVDKGEYFPIV